MLVVPSGEVVAAVEVHELWVIDGVGSWGLRWL